LYKKAAHKNLAITLPSRKISFFEKNIRNLKIEIVVVVDCRVREREVEIVYDNMK
jgi:hypothetical protein